MKEITKDMTVGKPGKLIFDFALSLMLGYFLLVSGSIRLVICCKGDAPSMMAAS